MHCRFCRFSWLPALALASVVGCARSPAPAERGEVGERGFRRHGEAAYRADAPAMPTPSMVAGGWEAERLWSPAIDWEPFVAVDPQTADVYQLTTRYHVPECPACPDPTIVFRRSGDAGATWSQDSYPSRRGGGLADPQVEVGLDGTLYVAFLQDFVPGVVLVRSTDRGETWSRPLRAIGAGPPRWSDKPSLAISQDGRDVYLAFNASDSYVVASHDAGETFSAPVRTNDDERYWFHSDGAVAPDGTVWFAAADYSQTYAGESHVSLLRSEDGGASWTTLRLDTAAEAPRCRWWAAGCYRGFLGPSVALAIDAAGSMMVAYNAGTREGAPPALWIRTSADGFEWSPRQRVSGGGAAVHHAFPAVAAGPLPGDFRLVWQDDRRTARPRGTNTDRRWNTWYRRSRDAGRSWGHRLRLSRGALGPGEEEAYRTRRGYRFPYGDYLGVAVDVGGTSHVIWGAGASYSGNGGTWYTRGR
jgi:hypothetical protein